ncbi:unnamed protein product [Cylicocyclus nassatus]|uniref:Cyclin-like domain-containing protein n=1 Tax=Cylicocyclus nassatus TaxID=53992 RepID=A0AA36GK37_CYLNA|nr:unnamed protein product [Cylicocyclus nassatus]
MAQRGLKLRRRSVSANEENIRRSITKLDTDAVENGMQRLSLRPRGAQNARTRSNTLAANEIKEITSQVREQEGAQGFFGKFLTTLGFRRQTTSEVFDNQERKQGEAKDLEITDNSIYEEIDLQSDHRDFLVHIACYPSTTETDWLPLGGHRAFTLTNLFLIEVFYNDRLATEVLPLAAYLVAVTVSKRKICRNQLEELAVAAVRLASKFESQYCLGPDTTEEFGFVKLNRMERAICRATDFQLHRCSALFFMRIIQKLVEQHTWQWKFAKIANQLAYCQMELATLRPTLLAGVVMRLCCLLVSDDEWPEECYTVLGEPIDDYDEPHAILCRLLLTVRVEDAFAEAYVRFHHTIERALSFRPGWIEEQSAPANRIRMVGNRIFHD